MDECLKWLNEAEVHQRSFAAGLRAEVQDLAESLAAWEKTPPTREQRRKVTDEAAALRHRVLVYLQRSGGTR